MCIKSYGKNHRIGFVPFTVTPKEVTLGEILVQIPFQDRFCSANIVKSYNTIETTI